MDLSVEGGALVVRLVASPRAGWDQAFAAMAEAGDDALLNPEAPVGTAWDEHDWEWPNT